MVKLIDRVLQLAIQHTTVGNDNNRLKDFSVVVIMQPGKPVRQPGNRIGFTGTGTVLNQIIFTGAIGFDIFQQLCHHIQLMIPWKDHPFRLDFTFFILFLFQMKVLMQDFQQAVFAQNIFPKIGSIIPIRIDRVPLTAHISRSIAALIEREKIGFGSFQPGCHIYVGQIDSKVHQNPVLKLENSVLSCPVELILLNSVGSVLSGKLAFQFH